MKKEGGGLGGPFQRAFSTFQCIHDEKSTSFACTRLKGEGVRGYGKR